MPRNLACASLGPVKIPGDSDLKNAGFRANNHWRPLRRDSKPNSTVVHPREPPQAQRRRLRRTRTTTERRITSLLLSLLQSIRLGRLNCCACVCNAAPPRSLTCEFSCAPQNGSLIAYHIHITSPRRTRASTTAYPVKSNNTHW